MRMLQCRGTLGKAMTGDRCSWWRGRATRYETKGILTYPASLTHYPIGHVSWVSDQEKRRCLKWENRKRKRFCVFLCIYMNSAHSKSFGAYSGHERCTIHYQVVLKKYSKFKHQLSLEKSFLLGAMKKVGSFLFVVHIGLHLNSSRVVMTMEYGQTKRRV